MGLSAVLFYITISARNSAESLWTGWTRNARVVVTLSIPVFAIPAFRYDGHNRARGLVRPFMVKFKNYTAMSIRFPCRKTLRNWCEQGFDQWLAAQSSEEGSESCGDCQWTLKTNSKFDKEQVFRWFALKDRLYMAHRDDETSDCSDSDSCGDKFDYSTRILKELKSLVLVAGISGSLLIANTS